MKETTTLYKTPLETFKKLTTFTFHHSMAKKHQHSNNNINEQGHFPLNLFYSESLKTFFFKSLLKYKVFLMTPRGTNSGEMALFFYIVILDLFLNSHRLKNTKLRNFQCIHQQMFEMEIIIQNQNYLESQPMKCLLDTYLFWLAMSFKKHAKFEILYDRS